MGRRGGFFAVAAYMHVAGVALISASLLTRVYTYEPSYAYIYALSSLREPLK